jgi:hypothetical protein
MKRIPLLVAFSITVLLGSLVVTWKGFSQVTNLPTGEPGAVSNLMAAIAQTAVVVEGTATSVNNVYDEKAGPWTEITLSNLTIHAGDGAPATLTFKQFGGDLPNGRRVTVSHQQTFIAGERYLVFLRNTKWALSPVVGDYAVRVASADSREVLVNDSGEPVVGLDSEGLQVGEPVFEPVNRLDKALPKAIARDKRGPVSDRSLDRAHFVSALKGHLSSRGLRVAGAFSGAPLNSYDWKHVQVARFNGSRVNSHDPTTGDPIPEPTFENLPH